VLLPLLSTSATLGQIPVTGSPPGLVHGYFPSVSAPAPAVVPELEDFRRSLPSSETNRIAGVFVKGKLALRVLEQPEGQPGFVTSETDAVSHFRLAQSYGTIGLIAHNTLAGEGFSNVAIGDRIVVFTEAGDRSVFAVSQIRRVRALSPWSAASAFQDLDSAGDILSAQSLFNQVYGGRSALVLQTCISQGDSSVWGRLFILARPVFAQQGTANAGRLSHQIARVE